MAYDFGRLTFLMVDVEGWKDLLVGAPTLYKHQLLPEQIILQRMEASRVESGMYEEVDIEEHAQFPPAVEQPMVMVNVVHNDGVRMRRVTACLE